jgi:hypothetical protein
MGAKITGFAMVTLPKLMGLSRKIPLPKKAASPLNRKPLAGKAVAR